MVFSQNSLSGQTPNVFNARGGYYKFPNGLIMQWGIIPATQATGYHGNFPIKFPHAILYHSLQDQTNIHFNKNGHWVDNNVVWTRESMYLVLGY